MHRLNCFYPPFKAISRASSQHFHLLAKPHLKQYPKGSQQIDFLTHFARFRTFKKTQFMLLLLMYLNL